MNIKNKTFNKMRIVLGLYIVSIYVIVLEWPDSWAPSAGCGCDWQLCTIVWLSLPSCGTQTQTPDVAAFHWVYQASQVCEAAGSADEHLYIGALCFKGRIQDEWG